MDQNFIQMKVCISLSLLSTNPKIIYKHFYLDLQTSIYCTFITMFVLSQTFKVLKNGLKSWNKLVFGNIHLRIDNAIAPVENIQ